MDEFLSHFDMFFHPLMELNFTKLNDEKILPRKSIKVLTYNIFLRPPPVKNNENDWKDERLADFIKLLDCYDIICFQEMFGSFNNRKQELIKYANKSGLFFYCDSPSPSFFSKFLVDGGLLILSRFPIVESEFRPFRYSVLSDSLAHKGILYAKIRIGDTYLSVFNTHLQASYFGSTNYHWDISVKTRIDHIDELIGFIKEVVYDRNIQLDEENLNKKVGKVILVGDFNVDAHNYEKKKKALSPGYETIEEYSVLCKKLGQLGPIFDIFKHNHNFHPYTFGYNGDNLKHYDQVLTAKEDVGSFQTLDYMFEIVVSRTTNSNANDIKLTIGDKDKPSKNKRLFVDYTTSEVEYFLISDKPYQQLSDHFGLSVCLDYQES